MPRDDFQIALEHHRAGRLQEAERGYRDLVEADPDHADARHWLGVLLTQAGQLDEAIELLERAAERRPDDPAVQHNLGQAYLIAGRAADAIGPLERALQREPERGEILLALARARMARHQANDADAAIELLTRALAVGADSPSLRHELGVALLAAGLAEPATDVLRSVLADDPRNARAHYHLALARRAAGDEPGVRRELNKALEIDPGLAQAWYALATLDAAAGNRAQAAASFRRAVRAKADFPAAYQGLARLLEQDGKPDKARQAYAMAVRASRLASTRGAARAVSIPELERRLTPDESTRQLHAALAAGTNLPAPASVPAEQIAELFDSYADNFDQHLRDTLAYRVPELIADAVAAATPDRLMHVLDLGCGTGLCGPLLRPMAATLRGVDLSPAMIAKARERGVYDELEVADLTDAMRRRPGACDLLTAADVFNYIGDLAPAMDAAAAALRPGGLLAFTVESATAGDRFELVKGTQRYAHPRSYVKHVARIFGFDVRTLTPVVLRHEAGRPVNGFVVVLAAGSSA